MLPSESVISFTSRVLLIANLALSFLLVSLHLLMIASSNTSMLSINILIPLSYRSLV
jgi:hypothetical protein